MLFCVSDVQFYMSWLAERSYDCQDCQPSFAEWIDAGGRHLLVLGEVDGLQVGSCCIRGGVDFLSLHAEPQAGKFAEVALARLGRVVGHKDQLLALQEQQPMSHLPA